MNDDKTDSAEGTEKTAADELKDSLAHLFAAARKVAQKVEPHVQRPLEDAEKALNDLGKGGESIARDAAREVASLASRLAEKLREVADREDHKPEP
jgi:phage shock protein A